MRTHHQVDVARVEPDAIRPPAFVQQATPRRRPSNHPEAHWFQPQRAGPRRRGCQASEPPGGSEVVVRTYPRYVSADPSVPVGRRLGPSRVHGHGALDRRHAEVPLRSGAVWMTPPIARSRLRRSVMPDPSFGIDEVERRPVVIPERLPDRVVVVDRDRICPRVSRSASDVLEVVLERELGCVHADETSPCPGSLVPRATYGSVRSQLMQVYVQKLTTTTFPRRPRPSAAAS